MSQHYHTTLYIFKYNQGNNDEKILHLTKLDLKWQIFLTKRVKVAKTHKGLTFQKVMYVKRRAFNYQPLEVRFH